MLEIYLPTLFVNHFANSVQAIIESYTVRSHWQFRTKLPSQLWLRVENPEESEWKTRCSSITPTLSRSATSLASSRTWMSFRRPRITLIVHCRRSSGRQARASLAQVMHPHQSHGVCGLETRLEARREIKLGFRVLTSKAKLDELKRHLHITNDCVILVWLDYRRARIHTSLFYLVPIFKSPLCMWSFSILTLSLTRLTA